MGKVFLIPDHHLFDKTRKRTEFTKDMLTWSFAKEDCQSMYRNAISSFLSLNEQFILIMCLQVDAKTKILRYSYRCWGQLFFIQKYLRGFSHDTRYDNAPFRSLSQWPEIEPDIVYDWTEDQWLQFWIESIKKQAIKDLKGERDTLRESQKLVVNAAISVVQQKKLTTAILAAVKCF